MKKIHISTARAILQRREPVDLSVWSAKGEIHHFAGVVTLNHDRYSGVRNIKFVASGQIRKIRDCCIFAINDMEVYM